MSHIPVIRNYFETSHGKGVCDGLGAVVKNACFRAVISGKTVIGDALSLYSFAHTKFAHGPTSKDKLISKWDVVYVNDACHDRPHVEADVMKGCRKFHSVSSTGNDYQIKTRCLTCYCDGCMNDNECKNKEWVGPWDTRNMTLKAAAEKTGILACELLCNVFQHICRMLLQWWLVEISLLHVNLY